VYALTIFKFPLNQVDQTTPPTFTGEAYTPTGKGLLLPQ
jgi:hypothetical protein